MKNHKIEIIIVDDHPMVIEGLRYLLSSHTNLVVVQTFTTGEEAYKFLGDHICDVLLLDINLPDISGIELCSKLKQQNPNIKILGMSTHNDASLIRQMVQNGAEGYLLKNASAEELLAAIEQVNEGESFFSAEVQRILIESALKPTPRLTRREKEILQLIASGATTQQIAEQLFVSPLTIETHRRNIMQKFSVNNAAALIKAAIDHNFL